MTLPGNVRRAPIVAALLIGAIVAILNQTLISVALPKMMSDLNIDANIAQWLSTGFMLVNGVLIPVTAFLIARFSTRKLFISAMTIFSIGTLLCAIAPSFSILLIGRLIQAAGAGIMMPLMMVVILNIYPIERRGRAMGTLGIAMGFAPAIGPTLSGYIVQHYDWRVLFWIILPISVISIVIGFIFLKNVTEQSSQSWTFPASFCLRSVSVDCYTALVMQEHQVGEVFQSCLRLSLGQLRLFCLLFAN